ncbi:MAG: hypothetical protein ABW104_08695 [Candidatus Thiodiazotropha sp. 6PLUC2]
MDQHLSAIVGCFRALIKGTLEAQKTTYSVAGLITLQDSGK